MVALILVGFTLHGVAFINSRLVLYSYSGNNCTFNILERKEKNNMIGFRWRNKEG